jgi:cytochrome c oxidase subunit 2
MPDMPVTIIETALGEIQKESRAGRQCDRRAAQELPCDDSSSAFRHIPCRLTPKMTVFARGVSFGALVAFLAGCSALPLGGTVQSQSLRGMWIVFFWSGIFVAVVVYGLIAWCVLRYCKRPGDVAYPQQFRRNGRWEIFYTVVPIIMVVALFAISYPAERHVEAIAQQQGVVVDVTAFRWSWRFEYPQLGTTVIGTAQAPPEFELPIGETVRFNLTSVDVDHSFWVPDFLFKRDAIPGLENVFDWTPIKRGVFRGECAEFCGLDHALMSFTLKVVSRSDFDRWIRAHPNAAVVSAGNAR